MQLWDSRHFERIFVDNVPLLDVRAPVEFAQGAFPCAVNMPILTDKEREQVGICYKTQGPKAAVALGHQLVSGEVKSSRVSAWQRFFAEHPHGALYCFRGGQRSRIAQQWLQEIGVSVPRIQGGYKAMRRFLMTRLAELCASDNFVVIGGRTGTGKTRLLQAFAKAVDLEAAANHRGSAFGRKVDDQPSQIDFEHRVTIRLLQSQKMRGPWVLEDESRLIGRLWIPEPLQKVLKHAPLVVLEADMEARVKEVYRQYVHDLGCDYRNAYGDSGLERHRQALLDALLRIRKRLGGERYEQLRSALITAFASPDVYASQTVHETWIRPLLEGYYDRMYDYQLAGKSHRVVFRGEGPEVQDWLITHKGVALVNATPA